MTDPADLTLDEARQALAPAIADAAAFDGWGAEAVETAAGVLGIDPRIAHVAFPGDAMDMIGAWIADVDAAMSAAFSPEALAAMPVRERIRGLVQFRLDAVAGREESLRRALAIMAMPHHATEALRLGWHSADLMWRLAGDTATDWNHYSKRAILAAVYAATLAVLIDDRSAGKVETRAFLDRRIAGILRFEKAKARLSRPDREHFSLARFLGRLRYPAN